MPMNTANDPHPEHRRGGRPVHVSDGQVTEVFTAAGGSQYEVTHCVYCGGSMAKLTKSGRDQRDPGNHGAPQQVAGKSRGGLSGFVARKEVLARLKPLRPKLPRRIPASLKIRARTRHFSLVGTAFDYLLRFELRRRAKHAVVYPWVAERTPEMFFHRMALPELDASASMTFSWLGDEEVRQMFAPDDLREPLVVAEEISNRVRRIVVEAKDAEDTFRRNPSPTTADLGNAAGHALRLSMLDAVFRSGRPHPSVFDEPDSEDVTDLLALLAVVPFDELLDREIMLLNPHFADSSKLVGGADPDLIVGDMLVDVKTTMKEAMEADQLDALLGYLFLARNESRLDPHFPSVSRLALYFSRHGYLWTLPACAWTERPDFREAEQWFFDHAKTLYGGSEPRAPSRI